MAEETPKKGTPKAPAAPPAEKPAEAKGCRGCFKVLLVAVAILFFIFLLIAGAAALAVAATGLVEVPVLSQLIKPPAVIEDFSYKKVSDKVLSQKLDKAMSGTEGNVKVTIALTDDEANTLIAGLASQPNSPIKEILVKFRPGVIKVLGTLTQNNAQFYLEIRLAKSTTAAEFEIENARLGALPIPGDLLEGLVGQVLGTGQLLGKPDISSLPAREVTVKDGSIVIKGLDLSGLMGSGE